MVEELRGYETAVFRVGSDVNVEGCDLIVVGVPVYFEGPLRSVLRFLEENSERLKDKVFAVFVVCTVPRPLYWYARVKYLKPVLERIRGRVVGTFIARGWFTKPPEGARREVVGWIREVLARLSG